MSRERQNPCRDPLVRAIADALSRFHFGFPDIECHPQDSWRPAARRVAKELRKAGLVVTADQEPTALPPSAATSEPEGRS